MIKFKLDWLSVVTGSNTLKVWCSTIFLVLKDIDVNEHERLSKLEKRNYSTCIAVLHFTVTVESSIMSITYTLKWVWNGF